jgi:hypothetical protein
VFKIDKHPEDENYITAGYVPACNLGKPQVLARLSVREVALEAIEIHYSLVSGLDLSRDDK